MSQKIIVGNHQTSNQKQSPLQFFPSTQSSEIRYVNTSNDLTVFQAAILKTEYAI